MKGNGIKLIEKVKSEAKKQENQEISYVDAALGAAVELAYGEVVSKVPVLREGYLLTRIFADEIKQKSKVMIKLKSCLL